MKQLETRGALDVRPDKGTATLRANEFWDTNPSSHPERAIRVILL